MAVFGAKWQCLLILHYHRPMRSKLYHGYCRLQIQDAAKKSLPQKGSVIPPAVASGATSVFGMKPAPTLVLSASYTDKGGNNIKALTGSSSISRNSNTVSFTGFEKSNGFTPYKAGGNNLLLFPANEGWFELDSIDLTGVSSITLVSGWQKAPKEGFSFEARLDAPDGKVVGKGNMPAPQKNQQFGITRLPIDKVTDGKFHSIYFVYKSKEAIAGGVSSIQFNAK